MLLFWCYGLISNSVKCFELMDLRFLYPTGFKNLRGIKNYLLGVIIKSAPEISVLKSFKPAF